MPLALSDEQMATVMRCAEPLAPRRGTSRASGRTPADESYERLGATRARQFTVSSASTSRTVTLALGLFVLRRVAASIASSRRSQYVRVVPSIATSYRAPVLRIILM